MKKIRLGVNIDHVATLRNARNENFPSLSDVVILLISFRYTEEYSKLIRNTGFIIATILIRLSFSATGYLTMILILTGVTFAYLILKIYNAIEDAKISSTV